MRCCLLSCLAGALCAQDPPRKTPAAPSSMINRRLPDWVRFKGEYRNRWEGASGLRFTPGADDHYLLTRLRLELTVQPASWLAASIQGQDARIAANTLFPSAPPYKDDWDVRLAWVELKSNSNLRLRVGRQELTLGDQRLLGPGNWGNTARSFDAIRLAWDRGTLSAEAFAASLVAIRTGELNERVDGDDIHGVAFRAGGLPGKSRIEVQGLWRLAPRVLSERGTPGKLDIKTVVFRGMGDLTPRSHYVTEMAVQRGTRSGDEASSWAGHWRVAREIGAVRWKPVVVGVYDYATGDDDPTDGRSGTFDVLYPTPHDKYGLADQVGWKNIHHAEVRLEASPMRGWRFEVKQHAWWLASARDGLYTAGGALVARDLSGRSGRYAGRELDLQAFWAPSQQVALGMGVGRLWPGGFLKRTTPGATLTFPYVMLTYGF